MPPKSSSDPVLSVEEGYGTQKSWGHQDRKKGQLVALSVTGLSACARAYSQLLCPAVQVQTLGSGDSGHSEPEPNAGLAGSSPPPSARY